VDNKAKLWLFWIYSILGILGISSGVGILSSCGFGWITEGILSLLAIPVGLEYNKKFMDE